MAYDFSQLGRGLYCAGIMGHVQAGTDPDAREQSRGRMSRSVEAKRVDETLELTYDPDGKVREFYKSPVSDYGALWWAPTSVDPPMPHRLQMVERAYEGGKWVTKLVEHRVKSGKELKELSDTEQYQRSRFFESTGDWPSARGKFSESEYGRALGKGDVDPTAFGPGTGRMKFREGAFAFGGDDSVGSSGSGASVTSQMDGEFIPIMGGPFNRNLTLYAHWEMTARAFYEKNHSELAKTAVAITTDFTIGTGVSFRIKNPRVLEVWREFWDRNNMTERIATWSDDLTWQGELLVRKTERLKGFLTVRELDPSVILEIVCNVEDVEEVYFYHHSAPTLWQLPYSNFQGKNLQIPFNKYVITQYPAPEVYHAKLNISAGEKWGRSDFYPAFGILKRDRDWMTAAVLKDILHANLIFDVAINGDQGDVDAFLGDPMNDQLPGPGGTWVHNAALTLTPHHADVSSSQRAGAGNVGQMLASRFATALQMPSQYFNVAAAGPARATALTQSEPHVKRIIRRQGVMQRLLDHLFEEVITRALRAGRLTRADLMYGADPEWFFPPVYEEDRGALFRDFDNLFEKRSVSHRTMSSAKARQLGLDEYDYDAEQRELQRESTLPIIGAIISPPQPTMLPGMPGQPGQPGQQPPQLQQQPDAEGRENLNSGDAKARFRHQQQDADGAEPPGVDR